MLHINTSVSITGEYKNLKIIEVNSWIGVIYFGERKHIPLLGKITDRNYLNYPGVYFLLGKDVTTNNKKLYIGESEDIVTRLKQHVKNKNWFEEFIVFTTKTGDLNKAHIQLIESYFIELIKANFPSLTLDNGCGSNTIKSENLHSTVRTTAKEFIEKIRLILNTLNIVDLTVPSPQPIKKSRKNKVKTLPNTSESNKTNIAIKKYNSKPLVFFKTLPKLPKHFKAKMFISNNNYVLLKDSYIMKNPKNSFKKHTKYKSWVNVIENYCKPSPDNPNCYITIADVTCKSPSEAGSIVNAYSTNGRTEWKLPDGTTLKEYQENNK